MSFSERVSNRLLELKNIERYRTLNIPKGIDFCSNDYLGLSDHLELKNALKEGIDLYGGGSTASRLIRGHRDVFTLLEEKFSKWVKSPSSLFLANGFLANLGLINCIADKKTKIFSDRLNHASILDGIQLSGAEVRYYRHLDLNHLEDLLKKNNSSDEKLVITESIFSMDGDSANLEELVFLRNKFQFVLIVDEAHALGIFGAQGSGLANSYEKYISDDIDFRIFTAGKSMGLEGSFISCKKEFREYLINHLRTFIFSTAPLPAIAHALLTSISLIKEMNLERNNIIKNSQLLRSELNKNGYSTKNSNSHIIPVLLPDDSSTMKLASVLQEKGFDIRGVRPPTVKEPRLRIIINSKINENDILQLIQAFNIY